MKAQIKRSATDKVVAGVAAGLADYFDVDPVLIRIVFVVLAFMNGIGVLAYIVCIFAMPKDYTRLNVATAAAQSQNEENVTSAGVAAIAVEQPNKKTKVTTYFGYLLILLGAVFFIDNMFPFMDFEDVMPVVVMLIGAWMVYSGRLQNTLKVTENAKNSEINNDYTQNTEMNSESVTEMQNNAKSDEASK